MNKEFLFLTELDDNKVEQLLAYSSYNDNSLDSIKSKVKQKTTSKRISGVKRIFIIAAVLILGAGAVVAATVDFDRTHILLLGNQAELMYDHGDQKGLVIEADGIEVELVSVMRYEHELAMIIAIRDVAKDRIDGFTTFAALLEYVKDDTINKLQNRSRIDEFDKKTQTYLTILRFALPENNCAKELTLNIPSIFSRLVEVEEKMPNINLYEIVSNHVPTIVIDTDDIRNREHLKTGELHIPFFENVHWTYISNMGFLDGRFHIQIKNEIFIGTKIQITPWLVEPNGTRHGRGRYGSLNVEQRHLSQGYFEYIFEDINDIAQLRGMAFEKSGRGATEFFGEEWSFTFALPEKINSLTIPINEKISLSESEKIFLEKVVLTPLSADMVFLVGEDVEQLDFYAVRETFDDFYDWPFLTYDDGTTVHLHFTIRQYTPLPCPFGSERREINFHHMRGAYLLRDFGIDRAIELDRITSFTIQGMEFKR